MGSQQLRKTENLRPRVHPGAKKPSPSGLAAAAREESPGLRLIPPLTRGSSLLAAAAAGGAAWPQDSRLEPHRLWQIWLWKQTRSPEQPGAPVPCVSCSCCPRCSHCTRFLWVQVPEPLLPGLQELFTSPGFHHHLASSIWVSVQTSLIGQSGHFSIVMLVSSLPRGTGFRSRFRSFHLVSPACRLALVVPRASNVYQSYATMKSVYMCLPNRVRAFVRTYTHSHAQIPNLPLLFFSLLFPFFSLFSFFFFECKIIVAIWALT